MEKQLLERFISKYNLNGTLEAIILESKDGKVSTRAMSDDKNILALVETDSVDLEEGEYGIYNTAQWKSMLNVLDDSIKLKIMKVSDKPRGFLMSDKSTKVTFGLSDLDNIPKSPTPTNIPPFEVVIKIDDHFLNTFIRAKGALPDVNTFTVTSDGKKAEVILGWVAGNKQNTDRITLSVTATENVEFDAVSFPASYLKEIFLANKGVEGTMSVSSKGLTYIVFSDKQFKAEYYLVKVEKD